LAAAAAEDDDDDDGEEEEDDGSLRVDNSLRCSSSECRNLFSLFIVASSSSLSTR